MDLETDRLLLKNISFEDRDFIYSQFSDEAVTRYLYDEEPLTDLEGADEIIQSYLQPEPRPHHRWILLRKSDGVKLGTCGVHCWYPEAGKVDVGYDLKEEFQGSGYMLEAMKAVLEFAENRMRVKEVCANIYVENEKSRHLAEKLGFKVTGSTVEIFRGKAYPHDKYTLYIEE